MGTFITTEQHFLIKRSAKKGTKAFTLLLTGFRHALIKHRRCTAGHHRGGDTRQASLRHVSDYKPVVLYGWKVRPNAFLVVSKGDCSPSRLSKSEINPTNVGNIPPRVSGYLLAASVVNPCSDIEALCD